MIEQFPLTVRRFAYVDREGVQSARTVVELFSFTRRKRSREHTYLLAWDLDRAAIRRFRVDRILGGPDGGSWRTAERHPFPDPGRLAAAVAEALGELSKGDFWAAVRGARELRCGCDGHVFETRRGLTPGAVRHCNSCGKAVRLRESPPEDWERGPFRYSVAGGWSRP